MKHLLNSSGFPNHKTWAYRDLTDINQQIMKENNASKIFQGSNQIA